MKRIANASPAASSLAMRTKPRRRSAITALFAAAIALLLVLPSFASADPLGTTTMFKENLRPLAWVKNMSPGPDGNVWFTDNYPEQPAAIGRITSSGEIKEYVSGENLSGLGAGSRPISITAGPGAEQYLWFTDNGATPAIGYVDSTSPETAVEIPLAAGSEPEGIVAGPGGKLWFTDQGTTPGIFAFDPSSKEVVKSCTGGELEAESRPRAIVAGPDGNLWFADQVPGQTRGIGKVDPSTCAITESTTGTNSSSGGGVGAEGSWGISSGADGNVWFTESGTNEAHGKSVCRIKTSGAITCFKTGLIASSNPTSMASAPDAAGKLWFYDESRVNEEQQLKIEDSGTLGGTYKLEFKGEKTGATFTGNTTTSGTTAEKKTIKNITSFVGTVSKGELVSGTGIPPGDTIKAITGSPSSPTKIELNVAATETKTGTSFSADLPYNASGQTVREALEKFSAIGVGEEKVAVEGTNTSSPIERTIRFEAGLGATNVEQVSCNGSGLTGTSPTCSVTTLEQGVPNEIASIDTSDEEHEITRYPLSQLLWNGNAISNGPGGNVWFSVGHDASAELGKLGIGDNYNTLTVTKTGAGTGTVTSSLAGINCGGTCSAEYLEGAKVTLTAKGTGTGVFAGWSGAGCSGTGTCKVTMSEAKSVEAEFEVGYVLTINKTAGSGTVVSTSSAGINCGTECAAAFKKGSIVTLTASPAVGYTINSWTGCLAKPTALTCTVEMSKAKEIKVSFLAIPSLTVEKAGSGAGKVSATGISCDESCSKATAAIKSGTVVLVKTTAAKGSEAAVFLEGSGSAAVGVCQGESAGPCTFTITEDSKVKVKFNPIPTHTLTVDLTGYGAYKGKVTGKGVVKGLLTSAISCGAGCSSATESFFATDSVTLTATSGVGYTFNGWTVTGGSAEGCTGTTSPCTLKTDADKTVTAEFK